MEQNYTPVPVSVELQRQVVYDLNVRFYPAMDQAAQQISDRASAFREYLEENDCISKFSGQPSEAPVMGVDASMAIDDTGNFAVALSVGVASSVSDMVRPRYQSASIFGPSSESFTSAANCLRVAMELESLRYASTKDQWYLYDGSFSALNYEVCKFAAAMTKASVERGLTEARQLEGVFVEAINSPESAWFEVFGEREARCAIASGKRGTSTVFTDASSIFADGIISPTDKMMLDQVLGAGEYTKPFSYEQAYKDSHGSDLPGYGQPSLKNYDVERHQKRVLKTFKSLRVVYFRPWPWSPVMKLEYNGRLHSVDEVLAIVMGQTQTRSVMEPLPLYLADLHSKQSAGAIKLYGSINSGRYPSLFAAYRTSNR